MASTGLAWGGKTPVWVITQAHGGYIDSVGRPSSVSRQVEVINTGCFSYTHKNGLITARCEKAGTYTIETKGAGVVTLPPAGKQTFVVGDTFTVEAFRSGGNGSVHCNVVTIIVYKG